MNFDGLAKSLLGRHPGESRGPEHVEITGFRLSPDLMLEKGKASLEFSVIVFSGERKKPPKGDLPWITVTNLISGVNRSSSVWMSTRRAGA
jgi:hypothetical protein